MKKNIGKTDRIFRIVIGLFLLSFAFISKSILIKTFLILGAIFTFYEALAGWCIVYALLGRNTCPVDFEEIDRIEKKKKL